MKFIKTENGELINAANLIEINLAEGDGVNEQRQPQIMYGIIATDIIGKEHTLGLWETAELAEQIFGSIADWLELDKINVIDLGVDNG